MFFEAMDLCETLDLKFNSMDSSHFDINFKQTINCQTTRANMNESSKRRTYWRYHCSVTYVTQQWRSYHENFSLIVTLHKRHRATIMPARMRANGNFSNESVVRFYSVSQNKSYDEPE